VGSRTPLVVVNQIHSFVCNGVVAAIRQGGMVRKRIHSDKQIEGDSLKQYFDLDPITNGSYGSTTHQHDVLL
jgi:hypothetical protein